MADLPHELTLPADAPVPYRTYIGADGVERRYVLTMINTVNFRQDGERAVGVDITLLGPDHDLDALAREVAFILHGIAMHFGDVAVGRKTTLRMIETVRSLR